MLKTATQPELKELDIEWIALILTARRLGFSADEILAFIRDHSR